MHLILLGAPGAGKGTQAERLAERLEIAKISTGDMLRDALRRETRLGLEAKQYMEAGELVPDEVILGMVRDVLAAPDAPAGAIFDGFPRTQVQAEGLEELLADLNRSVDAIVLIEVPDEVIVRRLSGRRTDPETGAVYHLENNPPPDEIADRVVQRPDDREDTVRHRLNVYREQTQPLVEFYRERGIPIHEVRGDQTIEEVQAEVLERLGQ